MDVDDLEAFGSWEDIGTQLVFFAIVYVVVSTVNFFTSRHYENQVRRASKKDKQYWLQKWSARILGSPGEIADKFVARNQPSLYIILNLVQFSLSVATVTTWINKSYTLKAPTTWETIFGLVFCGYFMFHGMLEMTRNEFRISEFVHIRIVMDILSCTSLLCSIIYQKGWLSLAFLRVFNAHVSMVRLVRASKFMSDFQAACLLTLSKFVSLMTICASTMFLVETLGDIYIFDESTLLTRNEKGEEISFFIMLYYSFVTISTVGYGDIYPLSGLGRIIAILMIGGGILFFTNETSNMLELTNLLMNGNGSYKSNGRHVIVTGGAVDNQNLRVFGPFVEELCHPSRGQERPQILLLSNQLLSREVKKFLKQWWAVKLISFLQGSLVRVEDMNRASLANAKMVFIIGDVDAEDERKEDERNLTIAIAIRNMYPDIILKVMLLKRESKKLAITAGIPPFVCYSNQNLEGLLLINSSRAPGISAIILNMIKQEPIIYHIDKTDHNVDYVEGLKLEIHGVVLKRFLWNLTYNELAATLYSKWEIVLVGLMNSNGFHSSSDTSEVVMTNKNTIAYILPRDKRDIDHVSRRSGDWDDEFNHNLKSILKKTEVMSQTSEHMLKQARISFHKIPSFRSESVKRSKQKMMNLYQSTHLKPEDLCVEEGRLANHILILCQSNRQWELIHVMARNIRQMQTTFVIKVVLLCPYEAPESAKTQDRWVTFIKGDPTSIADLTMKACIGSAARIILLSPDNSESTKSKQLIQDQKVVFVTSILEREFKRSGRSIPLILEFNESASHKLLPEPFQPNVRPPKTAYQNSYHLRSGQIVLVSDLLRVLATTFYTPGILDILLNILDRGDFASCSQALWSVPAYRYSGKTFRFMYMDCLKSGTSCFAIYRKADFGKRIPFVWTLPPGDTILRQDDMVYVMASKDWIMDNRKLDKVVVATKKIQRAIRKYLRKEKTRRRRGPATENGHHVNASTNYNGYLEYRGH